MHLFFHCVVQVKANTNTSHTVPQQGVLTEQVLSVDTEAGDAYQRLRDTTEETRHQRNELQFGVRICSNGLVQRNLNFGGERTATTTSTN